MRFNPVALAAGVPASLEGLSAADVPRSFDKVVDDGWVVDDGAVLLRRHRDSYHGDRSHFTDVVGYEVAVNGRGIPDLDLDPSSPEVPRLLIRRGVAFAWQALYKAQIQLAGHRLAAFVTVSPTLFDFRRVTGNATFCSNGLTDAPYLDIDEVVDALVVSVESDECTRPLAATT